MIPSLIIILLITLFLPLLSKKVEHNLEIFLFIVGASAAITSNMLSLEFISHILHNKFIYYIVASVFFGGILFKLFNQRTKQLVERLLKHIPLCVFVFLMIVILGLVSSLITAIISSLLLVEIVTLLPINRANKIKVIIISCFSIGLGAALTPVGEPLSTITISKLNENFFYIFNLIGIYIIPTIILLALLGAWYSKPHKTSKISYEDVLLEEESYSDITIRTIKIFIFIIALELLGAGFKPLIDAYILKLNIRYLYLINISSAVLDNATLASAEISIKMSSEQIRAVLMGLLLSGGMMIPGNIPNIISAGKLKIKSSEWIKFAFPLGLLFLCFYFVILFVI